MMCQLIPHDVCVNLSVSTSYPQLDWLPIFSCGKLRGESLDLLLQKPRRRISEFFGCESSILKLRLSPIVSFLHLLLLLDGHSFC